MTCNTEFNFVWISERISLFVITSGQSRRQCDISPDFSPDWRSGELRFDSRPRAGVLDHLLNGYRWILPPGIKRPDHRISSFRISGATPTFYQCLHGVHSSNSDTATCRLTTIFSQRHGTKIMSIYLRHNANTDTNHTPTANCRPTVYTSSHAKRQLP